MFGLFEQISVLLIEEKILGFSNGQQTVNLSSNRVIFVARKFRLIEFFSFL